jgi:hypothetical protein
MEDSQLAALIERLKTDEALRERFLEAERSARREARELGERITGLADANLAEITSIAEDAGFDISGSFRRPSDYRAAPSDREIDSLSLACVFTCCFLLTSAYSTETFGPACMEGPPWLTI